VPGLPRVGGTKVDVKWENVGGSTGGEVSFLNFGSFYDAFFFVRVSENKTLLGT